MVAVVGENRVAGLLKPAEATYHNPSAYVRWHTAPPPRLSLCVPLALTALSSPMFTVGNLQDSDYCSNRHYVMGMALRSRECINERCHR